MDPPSARGLRIGFSTDTQKSASIRLTCALPNIRTLNHGGTRRSLAKGDFIYDCIFFKDSAALYAKAVPSRGIVFDDGASAIGAYNLRMSQRNVHPVDGVVPYLPLFATGLERSE